MTSHSSRLRASLIVAICCSCGAEESTSPAEVRQSDIIFSGRNVWTWDIYRIDPGGSGLRKLTNSSEEDLSPSWSPDYRQIAFFFRGQPEGIYVMNADGSDKRLVTAAVDVGNITWSSDGTKLAFDGRVADSFSIYVVPVAGGVPQRLTTSPTGWSPSWSPDGTSITYASGQGYGSEIYVIDSNGRNRRNITSSWGELTGEVDPSWSPDGSQIAFARFTSQGPPSAVWIMNADGTNPQQITSGHDDRAPAWSPDGTHLVITRLNTQDQGVLLCIVRIAERRLAHCLTPAEPRVAAHPSW